MQPNKFQSSNAISNQALEYVSKDPIAHLNMMEELFISALKDLFHFMRENAIHPSSVEWSSFQARFVKDFQMMAHKVEFRLQQIEDKQVAVFAGIDIAEDFSVAPDTMTFVSKSLLEQYKEEILKALDSEPLNPNAPVSNHATMMKQIYSGMIGEQLGPIHPLTAEDIYEVLAPKPSKPKPLTYEQLKEKAVADGKISAPPVDKGDGLI